MGTKHFELAKIYLEITNIPIHIHNDEQKKTTNHNMNINSETKIYDKRTKIFSWNLKLDNNLLQIKRTNSNWMPQEIVLIFIRIIHIYI